jgi:hypothetical protein
LSFIRSTAVLCGIRTRLTAMLCVKEEEEGIVSSCHRARRGLEGPQPACVFVFLVPFLSDDICEYNSKRNSITLEQFRIEKGKRQNHSYPITFFSTLQYRPYHASLSLQAIPVEITAQTDMTNLWTYDLHNNSEGVYLLCISHLHLSIIIKDCYDREVKGGIGRRLI